MNKTNKQTCWSYILCIIYKNRHSLMPQWKNDLLEVKKCNSILINLSRLNLLRSFFSVTLFNSLMTLLSVRLRQIELRYDLIKSIWMYIWKCSIMGLENNKNWPCYETSKWHCKGQCANMLVNIYISKMQKNYHMNRETFIFVPTPFCNRHIELWHIILLY